MKLIHDTEEFIALIADGKVSEPVTLAQGCWLFGLSGLTTLDGVTLAQGCWLYGLSGLTTLDGVTLAQDCRLYGKKGARLA